MDLVGIHIARTSKWPIRISDHPPYTVKIHTCNRCQILSDRKDTSEVVELFKKSGVEPEIWRDRECIRQLFHIASGFDSMNKGDPTIRRQMIESRCRSGSPVLKKVINDVVHITEEMYPPEPRNYLDACKHFLKTHGLRNISIITSENVDDTEVYQCDAAIIYSYKPTDVIGHFKFYMNMGCDVIPGMDSRAMDLMPLYRNSRVHPYMNINPIADLYYDKLVSSTWRRNVYTNLLNIGVSTKEIEYVFRKSG